MSATEVENETRKPLSELVLCDEDLLYVSEQVTEWRKLLRHLFVSDSKYNNVQKEIEELEERQHQKSLQSCDCMRHALEIWRRRRGSRAVASDLLDVLVRIGRTDVKEGLELLVGERKSVLTGFGSTPCSSPSTAGHWRKILNDVEVPENEKILSLVNNPDVTFISLAGTTGSGKTFVLENLTRDLADKVSCTKCRVVKVSIEHPISVHEIAKEIKANLSSEDKLISSAQDAKRHVKQALIPYLQSNKTVLLILDLSLIPQCSFSGKPVLDFLYDLLQCQDLPNLNIVVSSLCSMKGCKIFQDLKKAAREIVMTELSHKRAVKFILSENNQFSEKCASYLCERYERSPHILKCIAQTNLSECYDLSEDNEAELIKALEARDDECRECVSENVEGKKHLEDIFSCLTSDQKKIAAQCLVFTDDFDIDRSKLVVDHDIRISVGKLHNLEKGALLLKSKPGPEDGKTLFAFPTIVGEILRNLIVKEDKFYFSYYVKAEERFCRVYLELLELLGNNFLGLNLGKRREVKILAPLTPTAGVPDAYLLSLRDKDERTRLLIKLFREHEAEILQSLKLCVNHRQFYESVLNIACKLPVLFLLNKLLLLHVLIAIYRKLRRMVEIQDDGLGMARINICIAFYWMHSYGFEWFHEEAKNFLEAAHEELLEHNDDEKLLDDCANCISKLGRSFAAEGIHSGMRKRVLTGVELIKSGISKWENKTYKSVVDKVLIASNQRHIAATYHQIGMLDKAEQIIKEKVQPVLKEHLGNHPLTVNSFNTLGVIKRKQKRPKAAKEMLLKAFKFGKELLGDHGDTARILHELGLCCVDESDQLVREDPEKRRLLEEAKSYFKEAAKMSRKVIGDREITAGSFRELLKVCEQLGGSGLELQNIKDELQRIEKKSKKYFHEVRNTDSVD